MNARPLIIPVETQVREFDAKLLLSCVAAERGVPCYLGFQNRIRDRITSFPPGILLAKGFAAEKATMLNITCRLGHKIYAWDEEGLVHDPPEVYHDRRMGKGSLDLLSGVFAWGKDYAEMVRACPFYDGTPIFETGNPRADLLRPAVRSFYDATVAAIDERFGRFILINSSFGINNTAVTTHTPRQKGTAKSVAASSEYWKGRLRYRDKVFTRFQEMVLKLSDRFSDTTVVLRPHPAENIKTWERLAERHPNLNVVGEGNVVPWLIAASALVHNGCMTAVERTLLGRQAIAYQPLTSETYDRFLPNSVSRQCHDLESLYDEVRESIENDARSNEDLAAPPFLDGYVTRVDGKLAADLIMDVLEEVAKDDADTAKPSVSSFSYGWSAAQLRAFGKFVKSFRKEDIYSTWHQKQQFPDITVSEVEEKIFHLRLALGRFDRVTVRQKTDDVFLIDSAA